MALLAMAWMPLTSHSQATAEPGKIDGAWQGKITVSGLDLRVALQFKHTDGDKYTGTFQSLDQGAQLLPLDTVTYQGGKLNFTLVIAHISWDGKLNAAGDALEGNLTQGASTIALNFHRGAPAPAARKPQDPVPPFPYKEIEVLYDNPGAGTKIGGTLTEPKTGGPFPAVLMITGSGQQDRNEALLGHKPFLVIADYLTRLGIAVLRVDDRGIGTSTGDFNKATTADFATDVESGVKFLKSRPEIRHDKIGLIGHSEGGVIAPMVAQRSSDVAFIVLMAGTGVDGGKILVAQRALIGKAEGASDETIKFNSAFQKRLFKVIAEEPDPVKAEPKLTAEATDAIKALPDAERTAVSKNIEATVKTLNSPWMRYFIAYDPAPALRKVKCPVLALNGSKDLQVPPDLDLPAIEAALKAGGNKDYTIKLLPGLNHLFQECKTGSPTEYAGISETVNPAALKIMGDWIEAHCAH